MGSYANTHLNVLGAGSLDDLKIIPNFTYTPIFNQDQIKDHYKNIIRARVEPTIMTSLNVT